VTAYTIGDRVLVGAITPCGQCNYCLSGDWSQCGGPIARSRNLPGRVNEHSHFRSDCADALIRIYRSGDACI